MSSDPLHRLQEKLEESQWWSPETLLDYQFQQLQRIVQHSAEKVPFYQQRLAEHGLTPDGLMTPESWTQLPVLTRYQIQEAGEALHSSVVPHGHTPVAQQFTSGSTGTPVKTLATAISSLFWRAVTMRDHRWHQRNFSGTLASIRFVPSGDAEPPDGMTFGNWGTTTRQITTGPGLLLSVFSTVTQQAEWLNRNNPHYLMTYPSSVAALAEECAAQQYRLENLREVRTFGEVLDQKTRDLCRSIWNVPVVDAYSCQETGNIALQCPDHEHYHVQAEDLLVEVIDDDGQPCQPGQTGRLIVTTLHNYAMPLLRYDIGDYAEVGEPCPCGRGLPVLKRIVGRSRNMFVLPDGNRVWPSMDASEIIEQESWPVRQYQVVQRDHQNVDAYLVALRPLTDEEEQLATRGFHRAICYPFQVTYHYVDDIPRSPSGKFEEFCSSVT